MCHQLKIIFFNKYLDHLTINEMVGRTSEIADVRSKYPPEDKKMARGLLILWKSSFT